MNKLDLFKNIVSTVVGIGTTKIVSTIIRNNVEPETPVEHVTVYAGSVVIGAMVADASKNYTDTKIDEAVALIKSFKNPEQAQS